MGMSQNETWGKMMNAFNDQKPIPEYKPGDRVTGFFSVRKIELKTKRDQSPYLLMELGDSTGRINATIWEDAKTFRDTIQAGDVVKVQGTVIDFNRNAQISIDKIRKAVSEDNVKKFDFVPKSRLDMESLGTKLDEVIRSVKIQPLHDLLERIFHSSELGQLFSQAPGGKLWHHAYLGGLLEHTLSVAEICETMTRLYPKASRDLLISGALLHDIGKIDEYGYDQGFIDFTDEGRLWGHISIGAQRVRKEIELMEKESGFPGELKKHLLHLILSHQGELEHGSPVVPMTLEGIILYYADEMDSKANAVQHIIERDTEPGKHWSKYVQPIDRFIYLGNTENPNTAPPEDELQEDFFG
jgi:3'-5' exoribonuclease